MGLFSKKKTSADYLKEIAAAQKAQAQASKEEAEVMKAQARAVEEEAALKRKAYNDEQYEQKRLQAKAEFEEKQAQLQDFYDEFNFDLLDVNDITQKSMSIISWLDTVDRKAKSKATKNSYTGETLADDNKSKEKFLIKKLQVAVDRLGKLDADKNSFEYIQEKLKSYEERARIEAELQRQNNIKKAKYISIGVAVCIVVLSVVLYKNFGFNPEKRAEDCKAKVVELLEKGKIDKAQKCITAYVGWKSDDDFIAAKQLLSDVYLNENKIENAIGLQVNKVKIVDYLIEKGLYDDAFKQCISNDYDGDSSYSYDDFYKNCVTHMCENGKFDEAKLFVKKYSLEYDDVANRNKFIKKMTEIMNLYQN